jgi:hypothetical protein
MASGGGWHVKDGVATMFARKLEYHLSGLDDLSGTWPRCGDDTWRVRRKLGKAHQIVGCLQLCFGGLHLRLGGLASLRCLIVVRARRPTVPQQRVLAVEVVAGLDQLALRGGEVGLRGAQSVEFILRFQPGHQLPGLHPVTHLQIIIQ